MTLTTDLRATSIEDIEQVLRRLSPERARSAIDFVNYLLYEQEYQAEVDYDLPDEVDNAEWLAISKSSFDFWDNEQDTVYDDLSTG